MWLAAHGAKLYLLVQLSCMVFFSIFFEIFFLAFYSKVINIRCSVENWGAIEKQLFLKNKTSTENLWIFLIQVFEFSVIPWFNIYKILEFDRNNRYAQFCFSKFIFDFEKNKRFADFLLSHGVPKKKIQKNIE